MRVMAADWTPELAVVHFERVLAEADRRYEQRFADQQKAVDAALAAQEKAVAAALASQERAATRLAEEAEKWRNQANEWRGAMTDREKNFVGRPEYDGVRERLDGLEKNVVGHAAHEALRDKVALLENWRSKATGAAVVLALFAGAMGAAVVKAFGG